MRCAIRYARKVDEQVFAARRYCNLCQRETEHEVYRAGDVVVRLCIRCRERDRRYESDRD